MKYQDKLTYIDESVAALDNGASFESIVSSLMETKEITSYQAEDVLRSAKNDMNIKYGKEIMQKINTSGSISDQTNFDNMHTEMFSYIAGEQVRTLKNKEKIEIAKMIRAGREDEEILDNSTARFMSEKEIKDYIHSYTRNNVAVSGEEKNGYLLGGFAAIGIGILLTAVTDRIWYGAIGFGFVLLFKAFSTPAANDNTF